MGILNFFLKSSAPPLVKLTEGCFTVDRTGRVLTSTLPQTFPAEFMEKLTALVLQTFRSAKAASLIFSEIHVQYPALKITARELRGGAIVFIAPLASEKPIQPNRA
jgi:hypothetical protein